MSSPAPAHAPAGAPPPKLIVVGLIEHDDRYVVTRRHPHQHLGGAWELPGGKVEPGESPEAALQREAMEELGVAIDVVRPLTFSWYRYPDRTLLLLFYLARTRPGAAPRALAAAELTLLDLEALRALEMPPANHPLKELLLRSRPA